ncbi:MAG: hypothetical protein IJ417_09290 [Bacteroidaceae bacterium]|nr:hypothetical protein [Bacteroidaceae bacterium]
MKEDALTLRRTERREGMSGSKKAGMYMERPAPENLLPNGGKSAAQQRTFCCPTEDFLLPNGRLFAAQQRKNRCPTKRYERLASIDVKSSVFL